MAWYRCVGGAGGSLKLRTASGRIATFSTNMVEAFKSLKSEINPVQDLHGYSKPWSGGAGKNKINVNNQTDISNEHVRQYILNLPAGTYAVSAFCSSTANTDCAVLFIYSDDTNSPIQYLRNGNWSGTTINATKEIKQLNIYSSTNYSTSQNYTLTTINYLQVESGSQATSFEPYSNICPISGFSALNVTRTGKNLCFDAYGNKASESTYLYPSGDNLPIVVNNSLRTAYAYVGKNQDVVVSFASAPQRSLAYGLEAYPALNVICHTLSVTALSSTSFKVNSGNYEYIAFYYCNDLGNIPSDCQIELGNQATDFEPYNGQTATVNFGQEVFGGVADVTNGKVTVNQTKAIFNGSENWVERERNSSLVVYQLDNAVASVYNENDQIGNMFNFDAGAFRVQSNKPNTFVIGVSKRLFVLVNISDFPNVTAFKSALSNNNLEIVYNITPIEITTTPENLTAISGENNVYSDTNGDTEVKYLYRE